MAQQTSSGVRSDTTPPLLEITSPLDGHVSEEKTITFAGSTEPGAVVSAGRYEAEVASDGRWSIRLVQSPGENRAVFVAREPAGNSAEAAVVVRPAAHYNRTDL